MYTYLGTPSNRFVYNTVLVYMFNENNYRFLKFQIQVHNCKR